MGNYEFERIGECLKEMREGGVKKVGMATGVNQEGETVVSLLTLTALNTAKDSLAFQEVIERTKLTTPEQIQEFNEKILAKKEEMIKKIMKELGKEVFIFMGRVTP